jgi:hypothetical protein
MRKSTSLSSLLVGAGALLSATFVQAVEPGPAAAPQVTCRTTDARTWSGQKCVTSKPARAAQVRPIQVSRSTLDRSTCNRQATKIERDTCLNRVESTA